MYNREVSYVAAQEKAGKAFVIRPESALPIGKVEKDPEKICAVYRMGREAAKKVLPALRIFLAQENT